MGGCVSLAPHVTMQAQGQDRSERAAPEAVAPAGSGVCQHGRGEHPETTSAERFIRP